MENNNYNNKLLEIIRAESLKLIKEQEALSSLSQEKLDDRISDIEEGFIEVNEKRLEGLSKEEDKAVSEENYVELQKIKQEKLTCLTKLIAAYNKKQEYLTQLKNLLSSELNHLDVSGSGIFRDKSLTELNSLEVQKGTKIKISSVSAEIILEKITENNNYNVISTNIPGVQSGDLVSISPLIKIGHQAKINVYRNIQNRWAPIGPVGINNVTKIIKNPLDKK